MAYGLWPMAKAKAMAYGLNNGTIKYNTVYNINLWVNRIQYNTRKHSPNDPCLK